jgi:hypothetical protein
MLHAMPTPSRALSILTLLVAFLALVAAGTGVLWTGSGTGPTIQSPYGERVVLNGAGLYRHDSVSVAAQALAQDVVTLVVGIPLLLVSLLLFRQGSLRGRLLLTGTLAYFLYTYASYAFGAAFNDLFLLYVALFSLSLFATVMGFASLDIPDLPRCFSPRLPRKGIAIFLFVVAAFLLFAWLGRILPSQLGHRPPVGIEGYTTLVIQVLDLGLIVPASALGGVLLLLRRPWGYLLASVVLIKGATLALAVTTMAINMLRHGVAVSPMELAMFPALTAVGITMLILLLRAVQPTT